MDLLVHSLFSVLLYCNLFSLSCHSAFQHTSTAPIHLFDVYYLEEIAICPAEPVRAIIQQDRWEERPGVISVVTEETRCDKKRMPTYLSIIYLLFLLSVIYIITKMDVIYWSAPRHTDITCEVKRIIRKLQKPSLVTKLWEKEKMDFLQEIQCFHLLWEDSGGGDVCAYVTQWIAQ